MNRRKFIAKSTQLATAAFVGIATLPACKESDPCDDLSGLTADDIEDRKSYNYVKETPFPTKKCINCEHWIKPVESSTCGGCGLFEGPVHLNGYCDEWVLNEA